MYVSELKNKDINKAIDFAISGMHFELYIKNKAIRKMYGKYFWYLETNRATHLFAIYEGDILAGVILAEIKGEPHKYYSKKKAIYVKFIDMIQKIFFKDSAGLYDEVNKELFTKYSENNSPDGEIIFLAANPNIKIKGIGTMLLNELEKHIKGKQVFLFTDDFCTYQFYEHRGFKREGEKNIELDFGDKKVIMTCFLYSKKI